MDFKYKQCPFCGGEEFVVTDENLFNDLVNGNDYGMAAIAIRCKKCDALKWTHVKDCSYEVALVKAVAGWNKRYERKS